MGSCDQAECNNGAEDPGGDPGERRAGVEGGGARWHLETDGLDMAQAGQRSRPQPYRAQASDDADVGAGRTFISGVAEQFALDDLLAVVREILNPNLSRSELDRCLRRHGVGNFRALKPAARRPAHAACKAYEPGELPIDVEFLPQMADEAQRPYLFVAFDRATRWVFVRVYPAKTATNARRVLRDLERAAPMPIPRALTDNGKAVTDRLFGLYRRDRQPRLRPPLRRSRHRAPSRAARPTA